MAVEVLNFGSEILLPFPLSITQAEAYETVAVTCEWAQVEMWQGIVDCDDNLIQFRFGRGNVNLHNP